MELVPDVNRFAEGSCLICCGSTQVLCTASVEEKVPPHVKPGEGWITAEYSMLPRANRERSRRDIASLKLSSRSRRDPAAHRARPALRGRSEGPGGAHRHRGLRRAAGGRRHPHRLGDRRFRGAGAGLPQADGAWPCGKDAASYLRGAVSAGIVSDTPCWTCAMRRIPPPWWTSTA